jgi:hypothetical protein
MGCPGKGLGVHGLRPPKSAFPKVRMWEGQLACHRSHLEDQRMSWSRNHTTSALYSRFIVDKGFCTLRILSRLEHSSASPKNSKSKALRFFICGRTYNCPILLISSSETRNSSFNPSKMFYKPGTPHNLPKDPFKACVIPRPIGWISSISGGEPQPLASLLPSFPSFLPSPSPFL